MCKGELLFHTGRHSLIGFTLLSCILLLNITVILRSAYAASKYSVQAWYDSARAELYDKNIKFTIINPGYIKTSLSLNALTGNGQVYGS